MNAAFISGNGAVLNGGSLCTKRNRKIFQKSFSVCIEIEFHADKIIEEETHLAFSKNSKFKSFFLSLIGYCGGLTPQRVKAIVQKLASQKIGIVFIDCSLYGILAKKIQKMLPVKVVVFFHNVEFLFLKGLVSKWKLQYLPLLLATWYNEKLSLQHKTTAIALNERDSLELLRHYKTSVEVIMPISLPDFHSEPLRVSIRKERPSNLLFVGSNFYANYFGIKWFIENVMPYVPFHLKVVGNGFEKTRDALTRDNVEIVGFVEDVGEYYVDADLVIAPIFDGSGMKVKTAEALKYGKVVMGTSESFVGYEKFLPLIGFVCDTAEQFVSQLKKFEYNSTRQKEIRRVFSENYSDTAMEEKFRVVFDSLK